MRSHRFMSTALGHTDFNDIFEASQSEIEYMNRLVTYFRLHKVRTI